MKGCYRSIRRRCFCGSVNVGAVRKLTITDRTLNRALIWFWMIYFKSGPTHLKLCEKSFTGGLNPSIISRNQPDPVSGTLGPSYTPNFCLITVVVVGFNSLWIKYDPVYDMNPSHFSADVPHTEALAFSPSVWWKRGSGWNTKPWRCHKRLRRGGRSTGLNGLV